MQRAVALAERIHGLDDPTVGTTLNNLATLYRAQAVTATPNRAARFEKHANPLQKHTAITDDCARSRPLLAHC
jgi:hypothetical protein